MAQRDEPSTPGRWAHQLVRYRPIAVAVVAALVIVLLPGGRDSSAPVQPDGAAPLGAAAEGGLVEAGEGITRAAAGAAESSAMLGSGAGSGESTSRATGAAGGAGAPAVGRDPEAVTVALAYPGVGTPEALTHPSCDRETGKFKFPSKWAPPCVRPWPAGADNGGATSPGVTAKEITVVVRLNPSSTASTSDGETKQQILDSFDIYNEHFEFWGRKLAVKFYRMTGQDETAQRADAVQIATMKPFLVVGMINATGGAPRVLSSELAARRIIVMDPDVSFGDSQAQPGFRWAYNIDDRILSLQVAEYAGKRLLGGKAKHAGDPQLQVKDRVFGMIHPDVWAMAPFDGEAAKYGLRFAERIQYPQGADPVTLQERARTQIARLKDKGVTTVVAATDPIYTVVLTREATQQRFSPEWISTGWNLQDTTIFSRLYDQTQWRNAFGVGLIPPLPDLAKEERSVMHQWHHGRPPPSSDAQATHGMIYLALRDLAPAIQLAGPNLTPERFRQAMFARPPAGGSWCDCRISTGTSYGRRWQGLAWEDYTGFEDTVESWWDTTTAAPDEIGVSAPGVWQRVNGGKRYRFGTWPRGEPDVFNPRSARWRYDEIPPQDRWKDYQHEPH